MQNNTNTYWYWKKFFGIETYKLDYYFKSFLYKGLGIKFPKLHDQRSYWENRGRAYMEEVTRSGYIQREVFFQDMLVNFLKTVEFDSFFEAGAGFGWNLRRVKEVFPSCRVSGVDFSWSQLEKSKTYMKGLPISIVSGDNCWMPYSNNSFDVGFSMGVFMNINPKNIKKAFSEMIRVCRKYIIHIEYDEDHTTPELREKRGLKRNIVSHNYKALYESLGQEVAEFRTYKDFGKACQAYQAKIKTTLDRWEGFEGPEKYICIVVKVK